MNSQKCQKITHFCRNFTRWFLLVFTILILIFALLSGSKGFGRGIKGIITNSPNAIPWLILLFINWIVWKSELLGSILLVTFAIAAGLFLGGFSVNLHIIYFITIPLLILAFLLILYHFCQLRQKKAGY